MTLRSYPHGNRRYLNATADEIEKLRSQSLWFGVPFLLLFGGAMICAQKWAARSPIAAQHRVLTKLSAPLRRRPHPVVRLRQSKMLPFYPSPTFEGLAVGYTWHGSYTGFFRDRVELPWESAGYYRQRGAHKKMVPSKPSRYGYVLLSRKVTMSLTLTLASPLSLTPLLIAFAAQLVSFGFQLVIRPYSLRRDNMLAVASITAVLCTLFFAGILISESGGALERGDLISEMLQSANRDTKGLEAGKWLLFILNVLTFAVLGCTVLLESFCTPLAQYLCHIDSTEVVLALCCGHGKARQRAPSDTELEMGIAREWHNLSPSDDEIDSEEDGCGAGEAASAAAPTQRRGDSAKTMKVHVISGKGDRSALHMEART